MGKGVILMAVKKWLLSAVMTAMISAAIPVSVQAAPETMPDGTVFDADYYAQQNPDVVAALGADPGMLYRHYVLAGKTEGRLPCAPAGAATAAIPADFDAAFYAAAYPDVAAALGSDPWTLYQHYVNYGRIEGRLGNAGGMTQVQPAVNYTGMTYVTKDMNGNQVALKDVFSSHKYTMVNIWATWCGPCRGELDELGQINREYQAKGCAIIGLLDDGDTSSGRNTAKKLLSAAGADYMNLVLTNELGRAFWTNCVPTSFFVDQTGNIVGEPIYGASPYEYRATFDALLRQ